MQKCSFFDADRRHVAWLAWGLVLALAGCIDEELQRCGNGYCPAGLACSERMDRCYTPDVCGNGEKEAGEACDDGDTRSGNGCSADCQSDERCGNGVIDRDSGEECDCGTGSDAIRDPSCLGQRNDDLRGPCRADCQLRCGDGKINGEELCDGEVLGTSCVSLGFDRGRIACSDACVPLTGACGHIGWRRETIGTENIYALWGSAPDDVYAVGERTPYDLHPVHHYDGEKWSNEDVVFPGDPPTVALYDVWGTGADSVYAVGESGMVIHYQAGSGWTQLEIGTGTDVTLRGIWGSAEDDIYVVGSMGSGVPTVMHYDGSTWGARSQGILEPLDFEGIWGSGPADVYAVGNAVGNAALPGRVLHFGGSAWEVVVQDKPYLAGIHGTIGGRLVAVGDDGFILERRDDGTWIESTMGMSNAFIIGAWASEDAQRFAVGRSGGILFSDGATWTPMQSDVTVRLESVWGIGDQVIATGWNGTLLHYQQQSWLPVGPPSDTDVRAVWASDLHTIYAVGDSLHLFQNGKWTEVSTELDVKLHSIWGRSSGAILVGGRKSIIGYHDSGTWKRVFGSEPGDNGRINAFWESDTGAVFAVGAAIIEDEPVHAQIVRCPGTGCGEPGGWSRTFLPEHSYLLDVWGRSARDVFAVGGAGTILHFDGQQWSSMVSGIEADLHGVWGVPDGPVYAVGNEGTILRYQGGAWSRVSLPYDAERFPWVQSAQFGAIWGSAADDIYVVGNIEGLILHYDGEGWAPVRTESDQPLLHVWGRRVQRGGNDDLAVFFAGEAGTVLRLLKTR